MKNVLKVFHTINDGLNRIESAPRQEIVQIVEALRLINEELCDKFIEILKEKHEGRVVETNSNS